MLLLAVDYCRAANRQPDSVLTPHGPPPSERGV